jgi:hypothetical protein
VGGGSGAGQPPRTAKTAAGAQRGDSRRDGPEWVARPRCSARINMWGCFSFAAYFISSTDVIVKATKGAYLDKNSSSKRRTGVGGEADVLDEEAEPEPPQHLAAVIRWGDIRLPLRSTDQPLYTRLPIIFSRCFSKVTIGFIPRDGAPCRCRGRRRRRRGAGRGRGRSPPQC